MSESIENPLVSVCCLTYNHELFIRECLDGFVMQQTNFPIEILIHDDASTDGTAGIIREYETKYPDLIKPFYQTENQYSKQGKILERFVYPKVRGKYVAFCEGDDYWTDPLKLQKQVVFLEENEAYSMCFHNSTILAMDKLIDYYPLANIENREYTNVEIYSSWTIPTASVLFRMDALNEKNYAQLFNPEYVFGDIILFLCLAEEGKIYGMSDIMSVYRRHSQGVSNMRSINSIKLQLRHHQQISYNFGIDIQKVAQEHVVSQYLVLSKKYCSEKRIFSAFITIISAFFFSPKAFIRKIIQKI